MSRKGKTAILVDGENISRLDMLLFCNGYSKDSIRRFYTGEIVNKNNYKNPWSKYEIVRVPRVGKEAVDTNIAMDMVSLYHKEKIRNFVLVSNDYDFGCSAIILKKQHPDVTLTVMRSAMSTSKFFIRELKKNGVKCKAISREEEEELAFNILSLLKRHIDGEDISLIEVAKVLDEKGFPYSCGKNGVTKLAKDLKNLGFSIENGNVYFDLESENDSPGLK